MGSASTAWLLICVHKWGSTAFGERVTSVTVQLSQLQCFHLNSTASSLPGNSADALYKKTPCSHRGRKSRTVATLLILPKSLQKPRTDKGAPIQELVYWPRAHFPQSLPVICQVQGLLTFKMYLRTQLKQAMCRQTETNISTYLSSEDFRDIKNSEASKSQFCILPTKLSLMLCRTYWFSVSEEAEIIFC